MDRKPINELWCEIVDAVKERTDNVTTADRTEYLKFVALFIGIDPKTLRRWLSDRQLPRDIEGDRKQAQAKNIGELHRYLLMAKTWRLAAAIGKALELNNPQFGALTSYQGRFKCFRLGNDGLIESDLQITNKGGSEPWQHIHTSLYGDVMYNHQGPIYPIAGGRIYMVGVGSSERDVYFRPMIFKMRDRPQSSVTFGLLLTERHHDYMAMASKVALVSTMDKRIEDPRFLSDLVKQLDISDDSNAIYAPDVLHL